MLFLYNMRGARKAATRVVGLALMTDGKRDIREAFLGNFPPTLP